MFGADKSGGSGVWNGMGVTKTPQCPTLIVTNVPRSVRDEEVKALFSTQEGYFSMRTVRGLYFVDYDSIASATNAMIKVGGGRYGGSLRHLSCYILFLALGLRTRRFTHPNNPPVVPRIPSEPTAGSLRFVVSGELKHRIKTMFSRATTCPWGCV